MIIFRVTSIFLLIVCCITIFSFSSQDAKRSGELSGGITEVAISVVYPDFPELSDVEQEEIIHDASFIIRKLAHFSIFMLLGVFSYMSIVSYRRPQNAYKLLFSSVFCLLYAISDEVHQIFVSGRSGEVRDVCVDVFGALFGIIVCAILFNNIKFLIKFTGGKNA